MMLSCLPVSLYAEFAARSLSLGDWFRLAAGLGLDGADISVAHLASREVAYLEGLRREAADAGAPIRMLVTYSDFTRPGAAERQQQADDVRRWAEAAARLGASFLRLTAGQARPGVERDEGLEWAADGLVSCVADARGVGVRLLYENHVRGAVWSANDFTQPAERFLEVVRRTEDSGLEVLFDTANCLALNDDPLAVLAQVQHRVGAVHLSDIRAAGAFEPTVIGTGAAPNVSLLRALVAGGFDGLVSIEEASRTGRDGLGRAVAFADQAWAEAGGKPR